MIGTKIRTFHHLNNLVKSKPYFLICQQTRNHSHWAYCYAVYAENKVWILQNMGGKDMLSLPSSIKNEIGDIVNKYSYYTTISEHMGLLSFGDEIIAITSDELSQYDKFLLQNNKQLNSGTNYDSLHILYFYLITNGSANLVMWALKNYYKHRVPLALLKNTLNIISSYSQLINKLTKGTPTAYNGYSPVQELLQELVSLRRMKRANDVMNMFNTTQKRLLKNLDMTHELVNVLNKFGLISFTKRRNFIRKMSTVEDVNIILQEMHLLTKTHYQWNKESLLTFVAKGDGLNCKVIYNENDIVIVQVTDYDSIKFLAKTTNWCISKNKEYWNNYIQSSSKQYIIFDFSKKEDDHFSIIGVTTRKGDIVAAHNFVNDNIKHGSFSSPEINSFAMTKYSIFTWLHNHNIPATLFVKPMNLEFAWNKDACKEFLRHNAQKKYIVLCDNDNKFAIRISSSTWYNCTGNKLQPLQYTDTFIIFFDFNKPISDPYSMVISGIVPNYEKQKEVCVRMVNSYSQPIFTHTFDMFLAMYNIPFNVIKRDSPKLDILLSTLQLYNPQLIDNLLQNDEFLHMMFHKEVKKSLFEIISTSIFTYNTEDIIKVFYKHGLTLSKLCGHKMIERLIMEMSMFIIDREEFLPSIETVNDQMLEIAQNEEIPFNNAIARGYLHALAFIISHEDNGQILSNYILSHIHESTMNTHTIKLFLECFLPLAVKSHIQLQNIMPMLVMVNDDTLWEYVRENTTVPPSQLMEIVKNDPFLVENQEKVLSVKLI